MAQRRGSGKQRPTRTRAAARAEQQKEAADAVVMPQVGVLFTKESAKGIALLFPVFALIGAVLALPFGLIEYGDLALSMRLMIAAVCGAVAGSVVGFVAGPSIAARRKTRERAGDSPGRQGRPGKAEVAEATASHERERRR